MNTTIRLLSLAAALATTAAHADDILPGKWEITLASRVPGDAAWAPSPFSLTECVTSGDARDPSRLIGAISTPGVAGCTYTEKSYSGGTFRFALDCAGSFALKSKGSVSFAATSFSGSFTTTSNLGGQTVEFDNRVSARRLGGC